jgi:LysM repeat protein
MSERRPALVRVAFLAASLILIVPLYGSASPYHSWPEGAEPPARPQSTSTPIPAPRASGEAVPADGPSALYYTVRSGDTLWLIARRFGVTVDVVRKANGFDGRKVLSPGMKLYLPYSNEVGSVTWSGRQPEVKGRGLHLVASIKQQACWLFRDGDLRERWTCSTGRPGSPSIPGNYTVQTKLPRAYNAAADFWMPAWLGIYDAGETENGIHGIPYRAGNGERLWTDLVGTPITFGCLMLEDHLAQELYRMAYVGMAVTVAQ